MSLHMSVDNRKWYFYRERTTAEKVSNTEEKFLAPQGKSAARAADDNFYPGRDSLITLYDLKVSLKRCSRSNPPRKRKKVKLGLQLRTFRSEAFIMFIQSVLNVSPSDSTL
jgi:hypothetical protein